MWSSCCLLSQRHFLPLSLWLCSSHSDTFRFPGHICMSFPQHVSSLFSRNPQCLPLYQLINQSCRYLLQCHFLDLNSSLTRVYRGAPVNLIMPFVGTMHWSLAMMLL